MLIAKKTLSYALVHFVVAVAVAYALTRDVGAAMAIGLVEPLFQTLAFAVHERIWARRAGAAGTIPAPAPSAG